MQKLHIVGDPKGLTLQPPNFPSHIIAKMREY